MVFNYASFRMSYPSVDALQKVLVDTVFRYAQDRKKAAGRTLNANESVLKRV